LSPDSEEIFEINTTEFIKGFYYIIIENENEILYT